MFIVPTNAIISSLPQLVELMGEAGLSDLPTWEDLVETLAKEGTEEGTENIPDSETEEKYKRQLQVQIYSKLKAAYRTKSKYNAFKEEFESLAEIDDGTLARKEEFNTDSGKKRYDKLLNGFNSSSGAAAVEDTADKLFGTSNFDPDNNFLTPAMDWVYYIINTAFSVTSQLVIWGLLFQAGFDVLYLGVGFTRAFLCPFGGGGNGARQGDSGRKSFCLPVISEEAVSALNSAGVVSPGGKGGDSAIGGRKVWTYAKTKTPVVIMAAVYLLLLAGGWWGKLISVFSGIAVSILQYVLQTLGLL